MSTLTALPTLYRNVRYRSRNEARWVVAFTSLKISFCYEPEGFVFDDGTCYLPDFFLPEINMWAECKPIHPTPTEIHKAEQLVRASGTHLLWLIGPPDFRDYPAITSDAGEVSHCNYRLDIYQHKRFYYDVERRLWSPQDEFAEPSGEYWQAVKHSNAERFGIKESA